MDRELFGLVAVALVFIAYIPYLRDIVKGNVRPHPFTWLVWGITAASIFSVQSANGSGAGAYGSAAVALFAFTIFFTVYRKNRVTITTLDIVCLATALIGIVFWLVIQQPLISIILLMSIELIGFIPTLIKGWEKPYEDSASLWGINSLRHIAGLIAIENYNLVTIINPLFWIALSFCFCGILLLRRQRVGRPFIRKRTFRPHN